MKKVIAMLGLALVLAGCGQGQSSGQPDQGTTGGHAEKSRQKAAGDTAGGEGFESKVAKQSYALGMDIGNSLKDVPIDLSMAHLTAGIKAVLGESEPRLSAKEQRAALQAMMKQLYAAREAEAEAKARKNAQQGKAFRAEFKKKEGVKVTESGLMYKVLEPGEGASPGLHGRVKVHYVGKLVGGKVFDSSRKRGQAAVFPVDAVIPGWTEALQLMKEGAKYKLVIPPDLAYGERGAGNVIGPSETLIFTVTLLKVLPSESGGEQGSSGEQSSGGGADSGNSAQAGEAQ